MFGLLSVVTVNQQGLKSREINPEDGGNEGRRSLPPGNALPKREVGKVTSQLFLFHYLQVIQSN